MENELIFRQIIDGISTLVSVITPDGAVDFVNRQVLDYFGKPLEDLKEWSDTGLVHPDDVDSACAIGTRAMADGTPYDLELRQRGADGVYRWFHLQCFPVRGTEGDILRWCVLQTNIDERKRAEEALRWSEHHLTLLVETMPALVGRMTGDGALEYVNQRVQEYFGESLDQLDLRIVHPDDRFTVSRKWRHALRSGKAWEDQHRLRRADGVYRWFYHRSEPLLDRDGRVLCWYWVSLDVHDCRELEEDLRSTRRRLSDVMQIATVAELSASIAHEINQPLASVVNNGHACRTWLSHDPPNLERALGSLERIIRDGHSAAEVVRRIRALFKEAPPVKSPLDINRVIDEVLGLVSDELRENAVIVETDVDAGLPMLEADHVQIQQTLINLLRNGAEAMQGVTDRAKALLLRSRRQGDELLIEVRDYGLGIEDPTRIFEPFFTTKGSGMGMGLAICRSIVEAHGGRVWATANDDAGMTFSLTLPLDMHGAMTPG